MDKGHSVHSAPAHLQEQHQEQHVQEQHPKHEQHDINHEDLRKKIETDIKRKEELYHELFPPPTAESTRTLSEQEVNEFHAAFRGYKLTEDDLNYISWATVSGHREEAVKYVLHKKKDLFTTDKPVATEPSQRSLSAVVTGLNIVSAIFAPLFSIRLARSLETLGQILDFVDFISTLVRPSPSDMDILMRRFDEMMVLLRGIQQTLDQIQRQIELSTIRTILAPHEAIVLHALDLYQAMINFAGTAHETQYENQFLAYYRSANVKASLTTIMRSFVDSNVFGVNNLGRELVNITQSHHRYVLGVFQSVASYILHGTHLCLYADHRAGLDMTFEENRWNGLALEVTAACQSTLNDIERRLPQLIDHDFQSLFDNRGFGNLPSNVSTTFPTIANAVFEMLDAKFGSFATFGVLCFSIPHQSSDGGGNIRFFRERGANRHSVVVVYEDTGRARSQESSGNAARRSEIFRENIRTFNISISFRQIPNFSVNVSGLPQSMITQFASERLTSAVCVAFPASRGLWHYRDNLVASYFQVLSSSWPVPPFNNASYRDLILNSFYNGTNFD